MPRRTSPAAHSSVEVNPRAQAEGVIEHQRRYGASSIIYKISTQGVEYCDIVVQEPNASEDLELCHRALVEEMDRMKSDFNIVQAQSEQKPKPSARRRRDAA